MGGVSSLSSRWQAERDRHTNTHRHQDTPFPAVLSWRPQIFKGTRQVAGSVHPGVERKSTPHGGSPTTPTFRTQWFRGHGSPELFSRESITLPSGHSDFSPQVWGRRGKGALNKEAKRPHPHGPAPVFPSRSHCHQVGPHALVGTAARMHGSRHGWPRPARMTSFAHLRNLIR